MARFPSRSTLLGGAAPVSRPADQRDPFPIYTLLKNAGLSQEDILEVGDELLACIRKRIRDKALTDDADQARRYLNDPDYRAEVNKLIVAEEIARFDFSHSELRKIDQGLNIGLTEPEPKKPAVARTIGPRGPEEFTILERPAPGEVGPVVIKSKKDGRVHRDGVRR